MKNNTSLTVFYIETILMIIIFVFVILVMTRMFVAAGERNAEAREITTAVSLAQNTAEIIAASQGPGEAAQLLNENRNASLEQGMVTARYDEELKPDPSGGLEVRITWTPDRGKQGTYVSSAINIYRLSESREEPVYTITTGVYRQEDET